MTKEDVAAALQEIGILLELKGEPSFRTLSYHTAARALLEFEGDFPALVVAGRVMEIHGIGRFSVTVRDPLQRTWERGIYMLSLIHI